MSEAESNQRGLAVFLALALPAIILFFVMNSLPCYGQDDFYPLPDANPGKFGYPYPPPAPDEPGVTFNRRNMLDGHPELQFRPRPQDEIWLISTRNISSCSGPIPLEQFECKKSVGTAWNQVPLEKIIESQSSHPEIPTVVFIHGNRTSAFWSRRRGKLAYQALLGNNPVDLPPVRYIIWSWPSDSLKLPLKDFNRKMDRSVLDGRLFGQFLSRLDRDRPVSLVTYSMGTQIGFTGIETACTECGSCPPIGMIAMAPVTHCKWVLSPAKLNTLASQIFQLRFCENRRDTALRAYKAICSMDCKTRYTPASELIIRVHPNAMRYDFSRSVGREHNIVGYVSQPEVRNELESLLLR